jgi:hypothetical protein
MASRIYSLGTSRSVEARSAEAECPKGHGPVARMQARVLVLGKVWIQRVAAVHCPTCGMARLTPAGLDKVNRGIEAFLALGPSPPKAWTPIMEFEDASGATCRSELGTISR